MKTTFHTIKPRALLLALLLSATMNATAFDFMSDGLAYNINDDGTSVTITYLSKDANGNYSGITNFRLPETVNHDGVPYSVTAVGDSAFHDCTSLARLTIPASITSINKSAFAHCNSLTELIVEDAATTLTFNFQNNNLVFESCPLEDIYLGRYIYYKNNSPFNNMGSIKHITLGNNVTSIPSGLANKCSGLTDVTMSENVTKIQSSAFSYCSSLKTINLPPSITSIALFAFYGCSSLESVVIPESVSEISDYTFAGCSSIKELIIPENVTSILSCAFASCTSLSKLIINDAHTTLETALVDNNRVSPFTNCPLDTIYYGRSTTGGTFRTAGVKSLTIGPWVKTVPAGEFLLCSKLESVTLPPTLNTLKNNCFSTCTALNEITIPASITTFEGSAFRGCSNLTSVTIEEGVSYIPTNAFSQCTALESIVIPSSVQIVDEAAFYECSNLKYFTISDGETPITIRDNGRFNPLGGCSLQELYMGRNVTYNGNSPFQDMTSLQKATLGEKVNTLGYNVFKGDTNLRIISHATTVPSSASDINVVSVEVPNGCAHLYAADEKWATTDTIYSMDNGIKLYPVTINVEGDKIITVNGIENDGFDIAENENVVVDKINDFTFGIVTKHNKDITDNIVNEGSYTFTASPRHRDNSINTYSYQATDIALGDSGALIDSIGEDNLDNIYCLKLSGDINGTDVLAIRNIPNLRFLDIKDANVVEGGDVYYKNFVTKNDQIGSNFIDKSSNILEIILPTTIDTISSNAFHECASIIRVEMPPAVRSIGYMAFEGCQRLHGITLPSTVDHIGERAFLDCTSLESINIPALVPTIGQLTFKGCTSLNNLAIEDGDEPLPFEYYTENVNWHTVSHSPFELCPIKNLYMGRNLGDSAFYNFKTIEAITIGDKVTAIPECAFMGCEALTEIFIPDNVVEIGKAAFAICSTLSSVRLSNSLNVLPQDCFSGCGKLPAVVIPDNVTEIGYGAFSHCVELNNIIFSNNLRTIGDKAFHSCLSLTDIQFNESLQEIGNGSFYNCQGLTKVKIHDGINSIDTDAFRMCSSLKSLTIDDSDNTLSLGHDVFYTTSIEKVYIGRNIEYDSYHTGFLVGNKNVRTLTIGENVTQVPSRAFQYCTSLDTIYSFAVNPPEITIYTFDYQVEQHATLLVPIGSKDDYMNHYLWKNFFKIEEFDTDAIQSVNINQPSISTQGSTIKVAGASNVKVFNLNGVQVGYSDVTHVTPGIYIVVADGITTKVLVK